MKLNEQKNNNIIIIIIIGNIPYFTFSWKREHFDYCASALRPTLPYPTSYLFAVPPCLCSPFLVSSLPSTRQHPISLSLHSLPSQKTLWLSQISRHNPCIGHHSLYLNSEGIFFHFLALWISGEIREGLMYHSISKYNAWMGGSLTLAWIFFKDLSTCTEGPQRWSFMTKKW